MSWLREHAGSKPNDKTPVLTVKAATAASDDVNGKAAHCSSNDLGIFLDSFSASGDHNVFAKAPDRRPQNSACPINNVVQKGGTHFDDSEGSSSPFDQTHHFYNTGFPTVGTTEGAESSSQAVLFNGDLRESSFSSYDLLQHESSQQLDYFQDILGNGTGWPQMERAATTAHDSSALSISAPSTTRPSDHTNRTPMGISSSLPGHLGNFAPFELPRNTFSGHWSAWSDNTNVQPDTASSTSLVTEYTLDANVHDLHAMGAWSGLENSWSPDYPLEQPVDDLSFFNPTMSQFLSNEQFNHLSSSSDMFLASPISLNFRHQADSEAGETIRLNNARRASESTALYSCKFCSNTSQTQRDCTRHKISQHSPSLDFEVERNNCPISSYGYSEKGFVRKDNLRKHLQTHERHQPKSQNDRKLEMIELQGPPPNYRGLTISQRKILTHRPDAKMLPHSPQYPSPLHLTKSSHHHAEAASAKRRKTPDAKTLQVDYCPDCDTTFATPYELSRHLKTVHKQATTTYRCVAAVCKKRDKLWTRVDNFRQHIRKSHKDEGEEDLVKRSEIGNVARDTAPLEQEQTPSGVILTFDIRTNEDRGA